MNRAWDKLALSREKGRGTGLAEEEWSMALAVGRRVTSLLQLGKSWEKHFPLLDRGSDGTAK